MDWIILIGDERLTLESVKNIEHYGSVCTSEIEDDRFSVEYGKVHVFYDYDENLISVYEEVDLSRIPYSNPRFIMMIFNSVDLMWKILRQDNFLRNIYIDDDHGKIIPIEDFIND
ncbi:hypothetical protein GCM10008018_72830 [Paenibacillus marchantiophytorum]|uniref:Uncharacterized protein n=1 Tax=Paenibacillus marchantiophytorum TaxID=1619310 RepID=A0ABQ1FKH8_9BACL|nr:hypothetical protein [Paenibacillus marchantiophytorum]GGA18315.1 hypothetical protein GCM10008018_72830 [Paenibacillus marchantiophytorum]